MIKINPTKKLIISLIAIMLMLVVALSVSAEDIPKPAAPVDPLAGFLQPDGTLAITGAGDSAAPLSISSSGTGLEGTPCTNLYATMDEYCSGHVRIAYQCRETIDGPEWTQISENCANYLGGGICVMEDNKAVCDSFAGSTSQGKKMLWIALGLIVVGGSLIFIPFLAPGPQIVGAVMMLISIWLFIKLYLGGV